MTTTRRTFLKTVGAASAVIPVLAACPAPGAGAGEGEGEGEGEGSGGGLNANTLATGLTLDGADSLILGKDSGGIYAMTSICTHQLCDMANGSGEISGNQIDCLCHGSVYDANGNVVTPGSIGPPQGGGVQQPLDHFKVTIDPTTKDITVDKTTKVDAATRAT